MCGNVLKKSAPGQFFGLWRTFVESPPIYDIKTTTLPSDKSPKVSDKGWTRPGHTGKRVCAGGRPVRPPRAVSNNTGISTAKKTYCKNNPKLSLN